jgi:hypothetical protein
MSKKKHEQEDVFEIQDLEDIVKEGREHGICPYYHQLRKRAHVTFLPYNYLLNARQ